MIGIDALLREVDQMNCSMWSHGDCAECDIYKGRGGLCGGYATKPTDNDAAVFRTLEESSRVLAGDVEASEGTPDIRLQLVDVENNTNRICALDEAKTWDWGNPEIMRVIGDWQITNYETLLFILQEKASKGIEEVQLFEAPRFMMLSGG